MKCTYRGHELIVVREKSLAGYVQLFYTACRVGDGLMVVDDFTGMNYTVREWMAELKYIIDDMIEEGQTYDPTEHAPMVPVPLTTVQQIISMFYYVDRSETDAASIRQRLQACVQEAVGEV